MRETVLPNFLGLDCHPHTLHNGLTYARFLTGLLSRLELELTSSVYREHNAQLFTSEIHFFLVPLLHALQFDVPVVVRETSPKLACLFVVVVGGIIQTLLTLCRGLEVEYRLFSTFWVSIRGRYLAALFTLLAHQLSALIMPADDVEETVSVVDPTVTTPQDPDITEGASAD
ncbi:hypothetical protein H4R33_007265, partial [Dimargaris cristalligena]